MTEEVAPKKASRTYNRACPECGVTFTTTVHDRLFCTDAHKSAFHNRSSKIGRSMVPLAMAWRAGRNAKGGSTMAQALRATASAAFTEMCLILDAAAADDRANNRTNKLEYVRQRRRIAGLLARDEIASNLQPAQSKAVAKETP